MTEIRVLKREKYKGVNLAMRLLGDDVIEYLFPYKGHIYMESFRLPRKGKYKEVAAASLLVWTGAEKVVGQVIAKNRIWYKLSKRLGLRKVEAVTNSNPKTSEKAA